MADLGRALDNAKPAAKGRAVRAAYEALAKADPTLPSLDSDTPFADALPIVDEVSEKAFEDLPMAAGETEDDDFLINQNYGQSCYLKSGTPPEDSTKACTKAQQKQPAFDDSYDVYNSGILPYDGPRGNTYRVNIAETTKPGTYYFYCAIHGLGQLSEVVVKEPGADVPSVAEIARAARKEALETTRPLERTFRTAVRTNKVDFEGDELEGPFAGLPTQIHGMINTFVPSTIRAKANEPITWKVLGGDHTISFDVPPYLPIVQFTANRVRFNPRVREPAGGAPKQPPIDGRVEGPTDLNGGTWDGDGFWSSGVVGAEPYLNYTLRIAKPGTYAYACLIHPRMIGRVVVS
jgi:plastocyanin